MKSYTREDAVIMIGNRQSGIYHSCWSYNTTNSLNNKKRVEKREGRRRAKNAASLFAFIQNSRSKDMQDILCI